MASVQLRIAARSLRRNWRHSAGASLAIAVGFAAIVLFGGYIDDVEAMMGEMLEERFMMGTLLIEGRGASAVLTGERGDEDPIHLREPEQAFLEEYLAARRDDVVHRVRSLFIDGIVTDGRSSTLFSGWGYDPVEGAAVRRRYAWDAWAGKPLHVSPPDSVLLARGLGRLLGCAASSSEPVFGPGGLPIAKVRPFECKRPRLQLLGSTVTGQVNAVAASVAGTVDAGRQEMDQQLVAMPLELARRLGNTRDVSFYTVLLRDPSKAEHFSRELAEAAAARGFAIDAMPWQASYFGEQYRQAMAFFGLFRGLMTLVVVAMAGAAVFSTMAKAVNERTREVGTLRSLGFLRRQITGLFALEALLLSIGACAVGLGIALGTATLVNHAGLTYVPGNMASPIPLGVAIHAASCLQVAAFMVAISVLAAWRPARRAAARRIPDALAWA
jgi:putative ABC transport system permease protein